jgi:hypothetical protein
VFYVVRILRMRIIFIIVMVMIISVATRYLYLWSVDISSSIVLGECCCIFQTQNISHIFQIRELGTPFQTFLVLRTRLLPSLERQYPQESAYQESSSSHAREKL